jgi:hypothetical protein
MKPEKKNKNGRVGKEKKTDDSGQMILLAGFLIAIAIVGLAVVVGGTFYSQSSPSDRGVSELTAQVSDQIETAKDVGLQNIVLGNENATKLEGRNQTELCNGLSNITKEEVRDQMALSEDEVLLEIELLGDCDQFSDKANVSYAMGQKKNARLPGVSVNKSVNEDRTFDCEELRGANFTCFDVDDNQEEFNDAVVDIIRSRDDGPYPNGSKIPDDYSEANNSKYDYTEDKVNALENVSDIKLSTLPGNVSKEEFANCIGVDVSTGNSFDCDDLKSASNLDDPTVEDKFQDELLDVVKNETAGDDVPEDYNQSANNKYNYTGHKVTALENLNGTGSSDVNISALPGQITDEPEYDRRVEGLAACVDTTVKGQKFNCTELTGSKWVDLNNTKFMSELSNVVENRSSGNYLADNEIPESPEYNESANSAYEYTEDKLYALDNMSSVDLDNDLPDAVEPEEFADCLTVALEQGESFTCSQIRNESGYNDGSNAADFSDELKQIVEDDPDAGGVGNVPTDYNESANDKYDYEQHKIDAINNVPGIVPGDISDGITDLDRYDTKAEALADCIVIDDIGREPVDVVFSIDRTGSMGTPPEMTIYQRHKDEYTTDSGRTYTRPDPFSLEYYKEYDETGVEFDPSWGESVTLGADFNTSVGSVGDFVYDGSELVKVVNIPPAGPPAGIPTTWTPVTTPGVETDDPSQYPVGAPNDCSTTSCDTQRPSPGSVNVGDVLEVDHSGVPDGTGGINEPPAGDEPVTAEIKSQVASGQCFGSTFFGICLGTEDDVYEVEYNGNTYDAREDALSVFEYKWSSSVSVEVEDEFGSTRMEPVSNLDYVEYEWEVPERLYLTQLGARAALDDLVAGEDRAGVVEYSTDNPGNAEVIEDLEIMSGGHESDMKESIDRMRPDGSTDITDGIIRARNELDSSVCNKNAAREATCHIILMTDGIHNNGFPQPDSYVDGNFDYENVTIHSIALGSGSDDATMEDIANPNGNDPVRPEGVFKSSNDPSDAKDIFEDIVGSIQDDADSTLGVSGNDSSFQLDANATLGRDSLNFTGNQSLNTSLNDISFNESRDVNSTSNSDTFDGTISASGGAIEEIYEFRMNMTRFEASGRFNEYGIGFRDVSGGSEQIIWQMKVRRNPEDSDGNPLGVETQITFESDIDSSLTRTMDNSPPNPINTSVNLSKPGRYIKMDLINEEFEVYDGTSVVADDDMDDPKDYDISAARDLIDKEASGDGTTGEGIAVETVDTGPDGANGTFALDLLPVNGNMSRISDGNLDFGNDDLDDVCDQDSNDMVTCGTQDENNSVRAYASAQIKQAKFEVTVEGPNGVSERVLKVDVTELIE